MWFKLALPNVIPKHKLYFHGTSLAYVRAVNLLPALPNVIPKHKLLQTLPNYVNLSSGILKL